MSHASHMGTEGPAKRESSSPENKNLDIFGKKARTCPLLHCGACVCDAHRTPRVCVVRDCSS